MIDRIALNRDIRKVITLCTGLAPAEVRPANQLGGATGDRWATVLILAQKSAGDVHTWANVPNSPTKQVTETADVHVAITVSVQFFRQGALTSANKLRDRITLTSALQLMQSLGLGFIRCSVPKDLSAVVNANWEERAVCELDFYVVSTEVENVDTFGTFPFNVSTGTNLPNHEVIEP
jgi:hypothetical protein